MMESALEKMCRLLAYSDNSSEAKYIFGRSVAPPCKKVIFAFERNYITSAMQKSMSDMVAFEI